MKIPMSLARTAAGMLLVFTAACRMSSGTGTGSEVVGDGVAKTEARTVGPFDAIEVDGAVQLELTSGPIDVSLSGDENLLPLISTTVSGRKLVVHSTHNMQSKSLLVVTVHAPSVDRIEMKGMGRVHASGIDVPRFDLVAPGASDIELSGKADRLDVDVAGLGQVHAANLVAKDVHVTLAGTGSVEVNATDKLEANVSGMGAVLYRGKPTVAKTVSGLGTVAPLS